MFCWRITKYDPKYRNKLGYYTKNEWICYSDVGETIEGKKLSFEEYVKVENKYLEAIKLFMHNSNVEKIHIPYLEKREDSRLEIDPDDKEALNIFDKAKVGLSLNQDDVVQISRLILRNVLWARLESTKMKVHFGYDYYMYICSSSPCEKAIQETRKLGLFVEEFGMSPYDPDPEE